MKFIQIMLTLALALCLLSSIGTAEEQGPSQNDYVAQVANDSARADLVSFLEDARNYTLDHGKEEALKAFSDPTGEFVKGDMYIFAYDFNGTL
ncbi:MAG: hypothetical protein PHF80_02260, partial [Methanothrix sp.]|nr:hypothetical protein [Methanothrix sp.]